MLLALTPVISALILCALNGVAPHNIFSPASQWNDELLYYKIVGGTAKYGAPLGWFGYNDSHGALAPFGPWSPLTVAHYVVYAALFGWGYSSPFICNTLLCCAALAAFALLARLTLSQSALAAAFYCCMLPFARYQLSIMSECFFFAGCAMFAGLVFYVINAEKGKGRAAASAAMLASAALLTASRPNYAVLFAVAGYALYKNNKKAALIAVPLTAAGSLAAYFWTAKNLCASYLQPMLRTEVFGGFAEGVWSGTGRLICNVWDDIKDCLLLAGDSVVNPSSENGGTAVFITLCAVVFALWVYAAVKKRDGRALLFVWLFALAAELLAVIVFSWPYVAARHLLPLTLAGAFVVIKCAEPRALKGAGIALVSCVSVIASVGMLKDPYYALPEKNETRARRISSAESALAEAVELDEGGVSWENTVIWAFDDGDGDSKRYADWGYLMAAPDGVGIDLVFYYYADAEFDTLQAKYLFTCKDSLVGDKCLEKGGRLLADADEYELYLMPDYAEREV